MPRTVVVYGEDAAAARSVAGAMLPRALVLDGREFHAPEDPGVTKVVLMPDVTGTDAERIARLHPGIVERHAAQPVVPAPPPVGQVDDGDNEADAATNGPRASKGPGGRWYVKRGREIISGPFPTEDDAARAASVEV